LKNLLGANFSNLSNGTNIGHTPPVYESPNGEQGKLCTLFLLIFFPNGEYMRLHKIRPRKVYECKITENRQVLQSSAQQSPNSFHAKATLFHLFSAGRTLHRNRPNREKNSLITSLSCSHILSKSTTQMRKTLFLNLFNKDL
jgi:hypothetical protein